jgi:hypothetical protein
VIPKELARFVAVVGFLLLSLVTYDGGETSQWMLAVALLTTLEMVLEFLGSILFR